MKTSFVVLFLFISVITFRPAQTDQRCPIGLILTSTCESAMQLTCQHREDIQSEAQCKKVKSCRCPYDQPLYENGKCVKGYECPKPSLDGTSTLPTGHNFIVAGNVDPSGVVTGMHISGLRLNAHWYHAVIRFKINDNQCAHTVRNAKEESTSSSFLSIRYAEKSIKLVDLLQTEDLINVQFAFGTGPHFKLIISCQVKVESIVDLRRYNSNADHPQFAEYIAFRAGNGVYVSRLAKRCRDLQQLIKVKMDVKQQRLLSKIKNGIQIAITVLSGTPEVDNKTGSLLNPLRPGVIVEGVYKNQTDQDVSFPITIERIVISDSFIINLFCPNN